MNKIAIIGIITLLAIFAIFYLVQDDDNISGEVVSDIGTQTLSSGGVKEFTIIASRWKFDPATITVNQGDKVKLSITSIDVTHGIAMPDYRINEYLTPGQTVNIEFTADRKGTFIFSCSVSCGVGHTGMRGKLIVK